MKKVITVPFLRNLLIVIFFISPGLSFAQVLTMSSTAGTESRCTASGTITVIATGGTTPYQYAITAGPVTTPNQSSNMFDALPPGTYTIRVTDNTGATTIGSSTVMGTYTLMTPTQVLTHPYCPGGSDGSIAVTIPAVTGRAPYGFQLIAPSPVTTGIITSGTNTYTFTGLPAGTYTYQVTDSCSNVQTRSSLVLLNPVYAAPAFQSGGYRNDTVGVCDSVDFIFYSGSQGKKNWHASVWLNNDPLNRIDKYINSSSVENTYWRVPYGQHTLTYTDSCGNTATIVSNFKRSVTPFRITPLICQPNYDLLINASDIKKGFTLESIAPSPVIYPPQTTTTLTNTLINTPPGVYTLKVTDGCGWDTTFTYTMIAKPAPKMGGGFVAAFSQGDSLAAVTIGNINQFTFPLTITVDSGRVVPYQSVKYGIGPYTPVIPKSFNYNSVAELPQPNQYFFLRDMPVGKYRVVMNDACGNKDTTRITINPDQVTDYNSRSFTVTKGCIGANSITLHQNWKGQNLLAIMYSLAPVSPGFYSGYIPINDGTPATNTFGSLKSGTYVVVYYANSSVISRVPVVPSNDKVPTLFDIANAQYPNNRYIAIDTIVIPEYVQPVVTTATQAVVCSGSSTGNITVNTTGGAGIFNYEITSPVAVGPQLSNVFTGLPSPGTYAVKATDGCGNSNTYSVSMSSLLPPNITPDKICPKIDMPITLTADTIYNAIYSWTGPGGYTATGRSITLPSYSLLQAGTYTVTLSLTGCSNVTQSYELNGCAILPVSLKNFYAKEADCKVKLNWKTAEEINFSRFEIERSTDGVNYIKLGIINANSNNSNYNYTDNTPVNGKNIYRLKMVDTDGKYKYSPLRLVAFNCNGSKAIVIYPNPVSDNINISISGYTRQVTGKLFNAIGQLQKISLLVNGTNNIPVAGLANGVYNLVVMDEAGNNNYYKIMVRH